MPKSDQPVMDAAVLEYELEQAWALMRHHERLAEGAREELARSRASYRLLTPKVQYFNRIATILQDYREGRVSQEAFLEQVDIMIKNGMHQTHLVEEAQARAAKAKGT